MAQLKDVLDAYLERDVERRWTCGSGTDEIDALYTSPVPRAPDLHDGGPAQHQPFCTHLLFGAKNIERIGDHTTNIAETVHYLVTGRASIESAEERHHRARWPRTRAEATATA